MEDREQGVRAGGFGSDQTVLRPVRMRDHRRRAADHGRHRIHDGLPDLQAVAGFQGSEDRRRNRRDHDPYRGTCPSQAVQIKENTNRRIENESDC